MNSTQEPKKEVHGESHAVGLGATVQRETNIRGEAFEENPGKNNLFIDYFIYLIIWKIIWVDV